MLNSWMDLELKLKESFKRLLLLNQWTDVEIISQEFSLGDFCEKCLNHSAPLNKISTRAKNRNKL